MFTRGRAPREADRLPDPVLGGVFLVGVAGGFAALLRLLELLHHPVALELGDVVDEQDVLGVVDLVLQAGREQAVGLDLGGWPSASMYLTFTAIGRSTSSESSGIDRQLLRRSPARRTTRPPPG